MADRPDRSLRDGGGSGHQVELDLIFIRIQADLNPGVLTFPVFVLILAVASLAPLFPGGGIADAQHAGSNWMYHRNLLVTIRSPSWQVVSGPGSTQRSSFSPRSASIDVIGSGRRLESEARPWPTSLEEPSAGRAASFEWINGGKSLPKAPKSIPSSPLRRKDGSGQKWLIYSSLLNKFQSRETPEGDSLRQLAQTVCHHSYLPSGTPFPDRA